MEQFLPEVFEGQERLSPGSFKTTRLSLIHLPEDSEISILEIGCGKGETALFLAKLYPKARIIAVDNNPDFIRHLGQKANAQGLSQQVQGMVMDMEKLQFPKEQFDVILCEGAVYHMGFERALEQWKSFLRPSGRLVVSDLCFLRPVVPPPCLSYWREQYPDITFVNQRVDAVEKAGYYGRGRMVQPVGDWIDNYYVPIMGNLVAMGKKYEVGSPGAEFVKEMNKEMSMYQAYSSYLSYVVFQLEKKEL